MGLIAKTFFYDEQIRKIIVQFMAIFAGMKVAIGRNEDLSPKVISTPIMYGSKSRVVADIKTENTKNKPLRLPMLSAYLSTIDIAPELRKGVGAKRRNTFIPLGRSFPDDVQVIHQIMPVPYWTTFELGIFTSNTDQYFQLLEQILSVFDPIIQIQTSDEVFDWTHIKTIELMAIRNEENMPAGVDRRIIQGTLEFKAQIYLAIPPEIKQDYIETIKLRLGIITGIIPPNNSELIDELSNNLIIDQTLFSTNVITKI